MRQRTKERELRGKVAREGRTSLYTVVKRNGNVVPFQKERVAMALEAAFRDTKKIPQSQPLPDDVRSELEQVLGLVVGEAVKQASKGVCLTVEGIQDLVEVKLMETGHHDVARDYIVYRDRHKKLREDAVTQMKIWRRDGQTQVRFNPMKIGAAVEAAFRETLQIEEATPPAVAEAINEVTQHVVERATHLSQAGEILHVELIQDQIEQQLMEDGYFDVAKAFIIYRRQRTEERARRAAGEEAPPVAVTGKDYLLVGPDGAAQRVPHSVVRQRIRFACNGLQDVSVEAIEQQTIATCYEGMKVEELDLAPMMAARAKIEEEPAYSYVAARLLLDKIYREAIGIPAHDNKLTAHHKKAFKEYIVKGIGLGRLAPEMRSFNLDRLADGMQLDRDLQFSYLGLQTLYDRYLIQEADKRIETPQMLWMRVAMGLSLNEGTQKNERAIEFYNVLSRFQFVSATPTLFNSGTTHSQLSSCYLSTVMDDLHHIFKVIADDAQLSKWAGGIGNDWTRVRATGSMIRGTNGRSQGVVPFLKVANDTAVAVNQCFAPDTLIYTANGPQPISEIEAGELVLGISGTYRQVLEKFAYNQRDPMVSLRVKHAMEPITVTAGHPFYAIQGIPMEQAISRTRSWLDKGKVRCAWVDASQLKKGDYIAQVIPTEVVAVDGIDAEDAYLYGLLLGDGHLSKEGRQWGISGNPERDQHLEFVRGYLKARSIHFWETGRGTSYRQIHWAAGRGAVREATTGRIAGSGEATLPFDTEDLYDAQGRKRIAPRLSHLPRPQALALIHGLIETDGNVSRGKEISFCNTSQPLVEGLRYQLLRLGIPTAGNMYVVGSGDAMSGEAGRGELGLLRGAHSQPCSLSDEERFQDRPSGTADRASNGPTTYSNMRVRKNAHVGRRSDGSTAQFSGETHCYDVRIPAVPELAEKLGCKPVTKRNWLTHGKYLFTRVKATQSAAITPFVYDLKVEGDESYMTTAGLAHNGGKRKGAMCAYLETWHLDIEDFLELRKNTGDERRRTHDMNTANWIPDLFIKRVLSNGSWTLFSPDSVADLHDLYGRAFEVRYLEYEAMAARGEIKLFKKVEAPALWRKMLSMLFETGHPWITFKDPSNIRSPQDHVGVIHSSNLCTEILLNTSAEETAVCNLGSVNLAAHTTTKGLDAKQVKETIRTAMRMLDNVIDINYYPTAEARNSNLRHRPVGLGVMGFQDALYIQKIGYGSREAVEFADRSSELIAYHAIWASTELAQERGAYPTYKGSKWDRGLLPIDTLNLLEEERGGNLEVDRTVTLDWESVRDRIRKHGMRNSNTMAIAPTATISNIAGVAQSIEPSYKNLYVKSNLSGDFTIPNTYLVEELKRLNLWDKQMLDDLKYFDGSVLEIERIPEELKQLFVTAFEIDPDWLIECGSRRQKWIDMGQSLNLYMAEPSGKKLHAMYINAWRKGLKTTYYLRTLGATSIEKSTQDINVRGLQPRWMKSKSASSNIRVERAPAPAVACNLGEACEACQ